MKYRRRSSKRVKEGEDTPVSEGRAFDARVTSLLTKGEITSKKIMKEREEGVV